MRNRQVLYSRRPEGRLTEDCFAMAEAAVPEPAPGQVLLRNRFLSIDPYQRRMMLGVQGYPTELREGGVMVGRGVAEVVASRDDAWQAGDLALGDFGWQHYALAGAGGLRRLDATVQPASLHLGLLGSSGETAWYGLVQLGRPQAGETVVVSAAGGAVGSTVGQIARLLGCRVIGIAGGAEKCAEVVQRFGFHACLDHRAPELTARLRAAAPAGVDVNFENVGGAVLDAVLPTLNPGARVALCGMVAHYNATQPLPFGNLMKLLDQCVTLTGFRIGHVAPALREQARTDLLGWWRDGLLLAPETVTEGLETAPSALIGLLEGGNIGKRVVRLPWGEAA